MATTSRPFALTGAAFVAATAIAAVPSVTATGALAGVPSPTKLSTAQYELTALTDITLQGINDAIANGWGGNLGPSDAFYPGAFNNDVKVTGVNGALYYVLDQSGFVPANLEDYYFEAGGVKALAYVGISSIFGPNSLPGQLAKAVFGDQTMSISDAVVALTAGIPVIGDLTSVYFTGAAVNDTTAYGTGLAGVLAYVNAKYPAIGGLIGNLNIGGSHSDSHSDSDDDEAGEVHDDDDVDDVDDDDDDYKSHSHSNSAASVLNASRTSAVKPVATLSAAAVAAPSTDTPAEPTTPAVTVPNDAPDETDAVVTAPAPKRVAAHASRAAAADKGAAATRGESKRARTGTN